MTIKFDYAKIQNKYKKIWLYLGDYCHTSYDNKGVWIDQNGNVKRWSYIRWKVVASGNTWDELMESAGEYFLICGMTVEEYIQYRANLL